MPHALLCVFGSFICKQCLIVAAVTGSVVASRCTIVRINVSNLTENYMKQRDERRKQKQIFVLRF